MMIGSDLVFSPEFWAMLGLAASWVGCFCDPDDTNTCVIGPDVCVSSSGVNCALAPWFCRSAV